MLVDSSQSVRRASSQASDPTEAVGDLFEGLIQDDIALAVFFASPLYDTEELATAFRERFGGIPLVGCTTAGEIGPGGYLEGSLSGFSLSGRDFRVESRLIEELQHLEIDQGKAISQDSLQALGKGGNQPRAGNTFGFLLVDGLSVCEEMLVSSLYKPLGDIPLFGGSAGDGLEFEQTLLWYDGAFHSDAAVLNLIQTGLPFRVFRTQHFVETSNKMVVTQADPLTRVVNEINGEPAAREYARQVGLDPDQLTPMVFSAHPVVVRVSGEMFVRSIAKVNEDESLTFFCAIEAGVVLTVAKGLDVVEGVRDTFEELRAELGEIQLTIGCDCILRSLEYRDKGLREDISRIMAENHTVGFATYGEQFNAMHVNQTLTGVAVGTRRET